MRALWCASEMLLLPLSLTLWLSLLALPSWLSPFIFLPLFLLPLLPTLDAEWEWLFASKLSYRDDDDEAPPLPLPPLTPPPHPAGG